MPRLMTSDWRQIFQAAIFYGLKVRKRMSLNLG
jgi:hypothetical protein